MANSTEGYSSGRDWGVSRYFEILRKGREQAGDLAPEPLDFESQDIR